MRLISWNVNGLRSCLGKDFMNSFKLLDADIFCLQETRMERGQASVELPGYHQFWSSAEKKGYSGTAIFSRQEPISESYGLGIEEHDHEGRTITLEYDSFILVNVYTPNSQQELARLDYRLRWEDDFRTYLTTMAKKKPVIICGDLNVAHQPIDLRHPKTNQKSAGFTPEERAKMTDLLASGFVDTFRSLHPERTEAYSWWSYRGQARANNAGWRIDYFLTSEKLRPAIARADIHPEILGSDHCPVVLELDLDSDLN